MASVKIVMNDLPLRPKKLAADELEGVFGGCLARGKKCGSEKDCCDGMGCAHVRPGYADINVGGTQPEGGWYARSVNAVCFPR